MPGCPGWRHLDCATPLLKQQPKWRWYCHACVEGAGHTRCKVGASAWYYLIRRGGAVSFLDGIDSGDNDDNDTMT
jgi:hypothetical protein